MAELRPNARANLMTKTARATAREANAEQVHEELDAEKQVVDERTAQLRAKRLAQAGEKP